ncbi:MAG: response regulator [bacterium]
MKKILLIEPDEEQAGLFIDWLKGEGYDVNSLDSLQEVQTSVSKDKFDIILMDIDKPEITEASLKLCRALKADERFADLPITIFTYRKDIKKISDAIKAGADNFVLKPFETDSFLARMEIIFKQFELKKYGRKVLDLNYINYLIALAGEAEREGFFVLAPVIFNTLILEKINTIMGSPVIAQIIKRCNETIGEDYAFMKVFEFSNGKILMEGVEKASKNIPVKKLANAFRDYVYAFLHLVRTLTSDILVEREVRIKDK